MTVYLDVLIVLNIYVNFFLLKATARLLHARLSTARCIITSLFGSLFSMTILLPTMSAAATTAVKLAAAFAIVAVAFGIPGLKTYLKYTFFFFAVNFIFCGVIYGVIILTKTNLIGSNNAYFYVDFSLITLIISTAAAYAAISIIRRIFDKRNGERGKYSVIVSFMGRTVSLEGTADTGNTLTDVFSGLPVIVCDMKKLDIPEECIKSPFGTGLKGMRFLPYTTVNRSSILPVFSPQCVYIKCEETQDVKAVDALIGISGSQGCGALFNPDILV